MNPYLQGWIFISGCSTSIMFLMLTVYAIDKERRPRIVFATMAAIVWFSISLCMVIYSRLPH
jgi:hypothetical protein